MYVDVLLEIKAFDEKTFTYKVPSFFSEKIKIGSRVTVPFGNRKLNGLVINISKECEYDTKEVSDVIDDEPILSSELINLGKYMRSTYLCSLMSAYEAMLPNALKFNKKIVNIKYDTYIVKISDLANSSVGEKRILEMFNTNNKVLKKEISNKVILKRLIEKGILKEVKEEKYRYDKEVDLVGLKTLTDKQKECYKNILESTHDVCLLRGVTGSGKTEIYMHLIKNTLNNKKTAIVLVPEISLTTQLISRFKSVFGNDIAVLHSSLSDGERYDEWRKIKEGKVNVVIGTRSAIFAPINNLGLIIIDEEHVDTYKQENNPRYRTIDIAIERAGFNNAKVLLGSATPSLESYARARVGRYDLVELLERVNNVPLPLVHIIDMKDEMKKGNPILSEEANLLIQDRLNKKEQTMILINRRGYSNYILCNECGAVLKCPNCDISLTYHKKNENMVCHYCGYVTNKPEKCSKCNSKYLLLKGIGTEKIEELLSEKYDARVIRMDRDTTSNKGMHEKIIMDFNNQKYDILIGTQMISKGLDFTNVTLVIVLNGDASLNVPDYRSSERTFSLLTQVSGRGGRGNKKGVALIQTYNPEHYSIVYSKRHDYLNFYNKEIKIRKQLSYPPFCFIVALRVMTSDYDLGNIKIKEIDKYLRNNLDSSHSILGPTVSLKINNIYKFQILIKYKDKEKIYNVLNEVLAHYKNSKFKLEIDFNPLKI